MPQASQPAETPLRLLQAPPTRREMLLFGLLLLAVFWAFASMGPRTVVVVPDSHVRVGVIT